MKQKILIHKSNRNHLKLNKIKLKYHSKQENKNNKLTQLYQSRSKLLAKYVNLSHVERIKILFYE